jgi:hypothetical protein
MVALGLLCGSARAAGAGDVTVFAAQASPSELWATGFGAALASTWFNILILEGEATRMRGEERVASVTTFTASALIGPPIGGLVPYGGIGFGVHRLSLSDDSDHGTHRALILGLKFKLKGLLVLKAEYRHYGMPDDALLPFDERYSAGAGIAF